MTDDKIALRALLEKSSDASMLREMISFAAERLMALEPRRCAAPRPASEALNGSISATDTATGTGILGPEPSNCGSQSSGAAATFLASLNRAGCPRRR